MADAAGIVFRGDAIHRVGAGGGTAISVADVAGSATKDRAGSRVDRKPSAGM
jgi:hypothetical protein